MVQSAGSILDQVPATSPRRPIKSPGIRIHFLAGRAEVYRSHMERLVHITDVVGEDPQGFLPAGKIEWRRICYPTSFNQSRTLKSVVRKQPSVSSRSMGLGVHRS